MHVMFFLFSMSLNVLPWNLSCFFSALLEKYQVSQVPRELGRRPGTRGKRGLQNPDILISERLSSLIDAGHLWRSVVCVSLLFVYEYLFDDLTP